MDRSRPDVFVLSAPSGAGKTSLAKALVASLPDLGVAVSHTTRPPRPGEQDGVHYHFVSPEQFENLVRQDQFLEYARVFGHAYGTSRQALAVLRDQGRRMLLDIDWQGARRIKHEIPSAVTVFILPPSLAALKERLKARAQDTDEVVRRRMRQAADEISHYREFDHLVVNDDFTQALADLTAIVTGGRPLRQVPPDLPLQLAGGAGKGGAEPLT
ncbi:MAG: guanylate kinase [Acidiferrobacteraceae bacterium]